jgi:hypothetical protein
LAKNICLEPFDQVTDAGISFRLGFCFDTRNNHSISQSQSVPKGQPYNAEEGSEVHYRGIIGVDAFAGEDGIDPKTLCAGVGVALDVQDAALLKVVDVSSLHLQGTLFTALFFYESHLTPTCLNNQTLSKIASRTDGSI